MYAVSGASGRRGLCADAETTSGHDAMILMLPRAPSQLEEGGKRGEWRREVIIARQDNLVSRVEFVDRVVCLNFLA